MRDGFGSLSRRSFEVRLPGHFRGKSHGSACELLDQPVVIQDSPWADLPPELLRDVIKRLEASESTWPARKHVVACASVCRAWREMCKEIVRSPEFSGKITFPVSLKQVRFVHAFVHTLSCLYNIFIRGHFHTCIRLFSFQPSSVYARFYLRINMWMHKVILYGVCYDRVIIDNFFVIHL
jgi:hypothetical protein